MKKGITESIFSIEDSHQEEKTEVEPLDLSPRAIALAQISKLRKSLREGDEDAAEALLTIASIATREFQILRHDFPELQREIAKAEVALPAMVSPIRPPYDMRETDRNIPYEVWKTLQLPIGESLPFEVVRKGGNRGKSHDYLYYLITEVIWLEFSWLRRAPLSDENLTSRIQSLPDLCKANSKLWAKLATEWIEVMNMPIEDAKTWIHGICIGRANTIASRNKEKRLFKLRDRYEEGDPIGDTKIKIEKERKPKRSELLSAMRELIQQRLDSVVKD